MHIHYLQHEPYEGLACIADWASERGHTTARTAFFEPDPQLPTLDAIDWLVIMGGSMSAYDTDKFHWLQAEKDFIADAIHLGKTVIGICLGAQLIADVLGAKVYPNAQKEIGWFDISLTDAGRAEPMLSGFPERIKVFHWHGDTFDLPTGAVHLMQSEACRHQAFLYGTKVLGLQFHFELSAHDVCEMVKFGTGELIEGPYIQTAAEIVADFSHVQANNQLFFNLLDKLANQLG